MKSEPPLTCGFYFKVISEALDRSFNHSLKSLQLTASQSKILHYLSLQEEGSASLKELETRFRAAQSTIYGMADRLEQKGLVTSWYAAADKRSKRIRITDVGRRLERECHQEILQSEEQVVSVLTEEERTTLLGYLGRICDGLFAKQLPPWRS